MSLHITSLNSGSNGNCYYIGNEHDAILVDVGISCREAEKRMSRLGLSMNKVKAVFISHEHSDHISGIQVLSKKFQIPVYITSNTYKYGKLSFAEHLLKPFKAFEPVQIGSLSITAFPKFHDAADPHSFIVGCNKVNVGIFTDIGIPCKHLIYYFKQCHAAFLEANYDEQLLEQGKYPIFLKNRIRGGNGHLSNSQALTLFLENKPKFMSHLLLAHLSKDNNCPDLVNNLFSKHSGNTKIIVASRFIETAVFHIGAETSPFRMLANSAKIQYSLF